MDEVGMQGLVVDAVNESGGFARKLSHRFLVGVADLLVKLPDHPAGVFEAKRYDWANLSGVTDFKLDLTGPQKNFLRQAAAAGMPAGVVSFMQRKHRGLRSLSMAVYTLKEAEATRFRAMVHDHCELGDHIRRRNMITGELQNFFHRWRHGA